MNRAAQRAALPALFLFALGLAAQADSAPRRDPGPAPQRRAASYSPAEENARCEGCHVAIAAEWRGSLHHTSSTDPAYQAQLAREPLPFCRACHAPEADPMQEPAEDLHELGVGCITCHVPSGEVLAAPGPSASTEKAPHAIVRSADFASATACARCHEFSFRDAARRPRPLLMQSTVSEHRASAFASVSCASCHMAEVGEGSARHKSHRFGASRDATFVRSAAAVTVTRLEGGKVRFVLEPRAAGHAFPTGDLFRRIALEAEAIGPEKSVVASAKRYLGRHFERGLGEDKKPMKVLVRDDRVGAVGSGATEVIVDLGAEAASASVAYRVVYQRVDLPDETDEEDARVEGEIVLSSGVLTPVATGPPPLP